MSEAAAEISAEPVIESSESEIESIDSDLEASDAEGEVLDESEGGKSEDVEEAKIELIRQLKLKIDGKDIVEELPFDITPEQAEYFTKQAQLAKMGNSRAQEAADLRKKDADREQDLASFMEYIQENPKDFLEKSGMNVKEFAEGVLEAEVERLSMSEEERKISELQEQLNAKIKSEEEAKEQVELEKQENLRNQYAAEYEKDLLDAIETSGLDKNPEIISRMTQYMRVALEQGIDLTFQDLAPLVIDSVNTSLNKLVGGMSVDQLISAIGEDKVKALVGKRKVKRKAPPTATSIKDTASNERTSKKTTRKNMSNFFDSI